MKVLVIPLDWGLGHATRMIPLIREFQAQSVEVVLAGGGKAMDILQEAFPEARHDRWPALGIRYARKGMLVPALIASLPRILWQIICRRKRYKRLLHLWRPDIVVADNHPGLCTRHAKTIYITHQTAPELIGIWKVLRPLAALLHLAIIKCHNHLWIPDYPPPHQLAGRLSRPPRNYTPYNYIGILSRFQGQLAAPADTPDILIVLSGPEPQRSILENQLISLLQHNKSRILVVRGMAGNPITGLPEHIRQVNHLKPEPLNRYMLTAPVIIARCGFSTIMDLVQIKRTAILIPTPGQPEQEYLGRFLKNKDLFVIRPQHDIRLREAIDDLKHLKARFPAVHKHMLQQAVKAVMKS